MTTNFEPGDLVMLKSGSDIMVVESAKDDSVNTVWFDVIGCDDSGRPIYGELNRLTFPAAVLDSLE